MSSKSRRFTTLFRFFPPLATLDRVNHLAAIAGWVGLTLGVVLATTYSLAYHELNLPQIVWGIGRVARRELHRGRTRHARMAGAARGEVLERRVRRRARAVRRVPSGRSDRREDSCERVSAHARRLGAVGGRRRRRASRHAQGRRPARRRRDGARRRARRSRRSCERSRRRRDRLRDHARAILRRAFRRCAARHRRDGRRRDERAHRGGSASARSAW